MFRQGFILSLSLALSLLATCGRSAAMAQKIDRQYELKAAYLYQFGRYVEWPKGAVPGDDENFVIGILGSDPFGRHLKTIAANKTIQDKKIVIRRFASVKEYTPCQILFIAGSEDDSEDEKPFDEQVKAVLEKTKGAPVLLVSDTKGLAEKGTIINFFIEKNRLKLEINQDAASRAGLKISSQLLGLKVVKIVKDKSAGKSQVREDHARIS